MSLPVLYLRKREERRLRAGHRWVFSNEVDKARSSLKTFEPGALAEVRTSKDEPLGVAYVNSHSLICARLLTSDVAQLPDRTWLVQQLRRALALREVLYAEPYYRWVFGESDGLPGLVVDRYGDVLVVQISTAGMERMLPDVLEALEAVVAPAGILLRNDSSMRALEGLESYVDVAHGEVPDTVEVKEGGLTFEVRPVQGQKTGWFYDQRENRQHLLRYVKGRRVLDLFSYVGAWGIQAAAAGASQVTCVDSSTMALMDADTNASRNQCNVQTLRSDVFDALEQFKAAGETFDVVIADPPAFIKRKKDHQEGQKAYFRLNKLAMEVLSDDGFLAAASCSYHLSQDELGQVLRKVSLHTGRATQILALGGQGMDHPVHPAIPETSYLKAYFARVVKE